MVDSEAAAWAAPAAWPGSPSPWQRTRGPTSTRLSPGWWLRLATAWSTRPRAGDVAVTVPVLTAVSGAEGVAARRRSRPGAAVRPSRGAVSTWPTCWHPSARHGRAVLLSAADLRRLDRDALSRVAAAVAVVGVASGEDEQGERRLRQLGVDTVVTADADVSAVAEAVHAALGSMAPAPSRPEDADGSANLARQGLRTVQWSVRSAGWSPCGVRPVLPDGRRPRSIRRRRPLFSAGPPCSSTPTPTAARSHRCSVCSTRRLLAGAARAANQGQLDLPALARHARQVTPRLRVFTGITRTERRPRSEPPPWRWSGRWPAAWRRRPSSTAASASRGRGAQLRHHCTAAQRGDAERSAERRRRPRRGRRRPGGGPALRSSCPTSARQAAGRRPRCRQPAAFVCGRVESREAGSVALVRYGECSGSASFPTTGRPWMPPSQGQSLEAAPASAARKAIGLAADLAGVAASWRRHGGGARLFG